MCCCSKSRGHSLACHPSLCANGNFRTPHQALSQGCHCSLCCGRHGAPGVPLWGTHPVCCSISLGTLGPAQHHHMGRAQPSGHIIALARGEWEEHSRGDSGRHTGPSCCGSLICCHQERRGCGVGVSCLTLRLLPPRASPTATGDRGPTRLSAPTHEGSTGPTSKDTNAAAWNPG